MPKKIIGTMTGTSLDGLDLALIEIDGVGLSTKIKILATSEYPYPLELKNKIKKSFEGDVTSRFISSLNFEIAIFYSNSINDFLDKKNYNSKDIDCIGSHGQTIYHLMEPNSKEVKSSLQLGDGSVIAQRTNITTISDFRGSDIAVGGQGAPLVPFVDFILYSSLNDKIKLFQNIGGISNVSVIGKEFDNIIGFDNGPGNMVIDQLMVKLFDKKYDDKGIESSKGQINEDLLNELKKDEYLNLKPPKSTGREMYGYQFVDNILKKHSNLNKNDIVRTLTYFTAFCIVDSFTKFIKIKNKKYEMIITGGGYKNETLVDFIKELSKEEFEVIEASNLGIDPDFKEAISFAILANQTLNGETSNVPSSTNATKKVVLGKISKV